jgi:hypothetical protein
LSRLERSSINIETFSKKGIFMFIRIKTKEELEKHFNWPAIQEYYDLGHTWRDIGKQFNCNVYRINEARKLGLFKTKTSVESAKFRDELKIERFTPRDRKHTQETKDKLRTIRINYLKNNPDKPAWKKHNKFDSIPCQKVKEWLKSQNIQFIEEFQPLLHINRFFSIDIAFPEKKIGIDINGGQHYDTNGKLKPYYQTRHDLIEKDGWILYEIPYHKAFTQDFLDSIPKILDAENKIEFNYSLYKKRGRKKHFCKCGKERSRISKNCHDCSSFEKRKIIRPNKWVLFNLIWSHSFREIGKIFNVKGCTIGRWAKSYQINNLPPVGYFEKLKYKHIIDYQI